ncbi:hypothetical protein [Chryseobacterium indoltheticum]|uniref:hypothetical protein n=1 Tax=Chryseobacterium indoltheticum TaxID=254 RepID=UPI001912F14A|nr:hypothetical protein [Chryseobacterium indoltheticum]QQQ30210.1 hypothetical protein JJL46_09465 [Chryseobacterium indoltheticum]
MENKKGGTFFFAIIAIIVGTALWKQFDFKTMTFEKVGISILYLITFLFCIFFLIRNARKK